MKEKVTFSIDKDTMELVRKNMPNMSEFVESCFKAYLQFATETEDERGEELRKAWETFNKTKLDIHLLMKVDYNGQDLKKAILKNKNKAWLTVWSDYRRVGGTITNKLEKASKTLEISTDELEQVLEDTLFKAKQDMTKLYVFDDWEYIENNIVPFIEIEEEEGGLDDLLNNF